MDKHILKGFTLVETLFCLSLIMVMVSLCLPAFHRPRFDNSTNEVLKIYQVQTNAIVQKEKQDYESIYFNSYGNISHGTTIHHPNYDIVFQLGNGRFYVRD